MCAVHTVPGEVGGDQRQGVYRQRREHFRRSLRRGTPPAPEEPRQEGVGRDGNREQGQVPQRLVPGGAVFPHIMSCRGIPSKKRLPRDVGEGGRVVGAQNGKRRRSGLKRWGDRVRLVLRLGLGIGVGQGVG